MMPGNIFPFDIMAAGYDAEFTTSAIGRLQRESVWDVLLPLLDAAEKPLSILEINCGTGTDATRLAAMGHQVIATDASEMMLNKAREKTLLWHQGSRPEFMVCPFNQLTERFKSKQFDLVFSNFGGLNCINPQALQQLARDLVRLTKPGALVFLVVMGSCCVNEIIHFGKKCRLSDAARRFGRSARFTVEGSTMPVYYYSPARLKNLFPSTFRLIKKKPVGLFIPPSYLEKKYRQRPLYLARLSKLEKRFGLAVFSNLADHYCAVFQNNEPGS